MWPSSLETAPSFMSLAPELLFYGPRRLTVLHKFASRRILPLPARGGLRGVAEPRLVNPGARRLSPLRLFPEAPPQQRFNPTPRQRGRLDPLLREPLQDHRLV